MDALINIFLPRRCANCQSLLSQGIFCVVCSRLMKTVVPKDDATRIQSLFIYGGIIRDLILRAKFQPDEGMARLLARHLEDFCKEHVPTKRLLNKERYDYVDYVPAHWKRRLARGYDLPAVFASTIARQLKLPLAHNLACIRHDPPISTATSAQERRTQVENRYQIQNSKVPPSQILLVDDIVTTGATLSAAADVLEQAGHRVQCFSFAKTESNSGAPSL